MSSDRTTLPAPGDTLDRYQIVGELARGGMGAVYAARRISVGGFDRLLAIKVLLPTLQSDERFRRMFLDEARIVSLVNHAHVVSIFDVGEERGMPFIVMELLRGRPLSKLSQAVGGPVPYHVTALALAHAARGLHAAHEARGADGAPLGIVHRDISPQNVFVGFDGHSKLIDFGVASARGRLVTTRSGEIRGKLRYMAPEQIDRSSAIDRRSDVWGLGVMTWELLANRRLFDGHDDATTMYEVLDGEIPALEKLAPGLPSDLLEVVGRCLTRDPSGRPPTSLPLAEALEAFAMANAKESVASFMSRVFPGAAESEDTQLRAQLEAVTRSTVAQSLPPHRRSGRRIAGAVLGAAVISAVVGGAWSLAADEAAPSVPTVPVTPTAGQAPSRPPLEATHPSDPGGDSSSSVPPEAEAATPLRSTSAPATSDAPAMPPTRQEQRRRRPRNTSDTPDERDGPNLMESPY